MRDFGFGTRSAALENLMQQEIQDVVDVLNGKKEDKVCLQSTAVVSVPLWQLNYKFLRVLHKPLAYT